MTEPVKKKFVIDAKGNRTAVILDMKTYEELIDEIDELNCALAFDQAKKGNEIDLGKGNYITLDDYLAKRKSSKVSRKTKA